MLVCWSVGGGVGTSVVAAGLAQAAVRGGDEALLVDLGGDQPALFGVPQPDGPGLAGWLQAGPDVPGDALGRLEVALTPDVALLPRGAGHLESAQATALAEHLNGDVRVVVVDAGVVSPGSVSEVLVEHAGRALLMVRACPVALRRMADLPRRPDGIVVVRERRRSVTWRDIAEASGAPVVAELEIDPGVAAAVDAGLAVHPLPRAFLRVLRDLR